MGTSHQITKICFLIYNRSFFRPDKYFEKKEEYRDFLRSADSQLLIYRIPPLPVTGPGKRPGKDLALRTLISGAMKKSHSCPFPLQIFIVFQQNRRIFFPEVDIPGTIKIIFRFFRISHLLETDTKVVP